MAKEGKTEKELEAIARERLGYAMSVRRDIKDGWYFQVTHTTRPYDYQGTLQRRANLLSKELGQLYELKTQ
jgi:hypothetical protein